MTRSVYRPADERRTAAEKGIVVAGASGRDAGTVPAITSDATRSIFDTIPPVIAAFKGYFGMRQTKMVAGTVESV